MTKREQRFRNQLKFSEDKSKFKNAIQILVALAFLNITILILLPSYLGFSSTSSLSYFVNDGWCSNGQGIGTHCFGDFYYPFNFTNLEAPWGGPQPIPYPPLSLFIFKIFTTISINSPYSHLSLNIYLVLSVLAMVFPSFHLFKKNIIDKKTALILGAVTLMSAPMIVSFDRGNLQMITTPLVYLCIFYFIAGNNKGFLISSCVLVLLKPQYILLGALFVGKHEYKELFKWISITSLTFLSSFVLYSGDVTNNLSDYLNQIKLFNHYQFAGILFPTNLSFSSSISLIYRLFSENNIENLSKIHSLFIPLWITVTLFMLILFVIWRAGPNLNRYVLMFIVLCCPILLPGVVFAYHANTLVIFFLFLGAQIHFTNLKALDQKNSPSYFIQNKLNYFLTISIAALLFIPFAIPWNIIPRFSGYSDGNVTISWTLLQFLTQVFFIRVILDLAIIKKIDKN